MAGEENFTFWNNFFGDFWGNPWTWFMFTSLVFFLILYKKGRHPFLKILDARSARIKEELEEAERLKSAAQELLADYQKKHRDAVQTAQKIIDNAKESAALIQKEAEQKLQENLKRREELLIERIARAETAAVQELRQRAADIAAVAAEKLLSEAMSKRGSALVEEAIDELPKRLKA